MNAVFFLLPNGIAPRPAFPDHLRWFRGDIGGRRVWPGFADMKASDHTAVEFAFETTRFGWKAQIPFQRAMFVSRL